MRGHRRQVASSANGQQGISVVPGPGLSARAAEGKRGSMRCGVADLAAHRRSSWVKGLAMLVKRTVEPGRESAYLIHMNSVCPVPWPEGEKDRHSE